MSSGFGSSAGGNASSYYLCDGFNRTRSGTALTAPFFTSSVNYAWGQASGGFYWEWQVSAPIPFGASAGVNSSGGWYRAKYTNAIASTPAGVTGGLPGPVTYTMRWKVSSVPSGLGSGSSTIEIRIDPEESSDIGYYLTNFIVTNNYSPGSIGIGAGGWIYGSEYEIDKDDWVANTWYITVLEVNPGEYMRGKTYKEGTYSNWQVSYYGNLPVLAITRAQLFFTTNTIASSDSGFTTFTVDYFRTAECESSWEGSSSSLPTTPVVETGSSTGWGS